MKGITPPPLTADRPSFNEFRLRVAARWVFPKGALRPTQQWELFAHAACRRCHRPLIARDWMGTKDMSPRDLCEVCRGGGSSTIPVPGEIEAQFRREARDHTVQCPLEGCEERMGWTTSSHLIYTHFLTHWDVLRLCPGYRLYDPASCRAQFEMKDDADYLTHLHFCPDVPSLPCRACHKVEGRSERVLIEHWFECPDALLYCSCKAPVMRKDMLGHRETDCPYRLVVCDAPACRMSIRDKDRNDHVAERHLAALVADVHRLQRQVVELSARVAELETTPDKPKQ